MNKLKPLRANGSRVEVQCPVCESEFSKRARTVNGFKLVRCRECSMVYVSPQLSEAELEKLYTTKKDPEAIVALYSRLATRAVLSGYDARLEYLEEKLGKRKGRLLDFACAAAYFTERAAAKGWEAHGVDIGKWVEIAAAQRGVRNIHVGDLRAIGFPGGYFDVVYAAQVLEHLRDPRSVLTELRRILSPRGILYVDVPNFRTLPIMLHRDDFYLNDPPQHINYFTPYTLRRLLTQSGFHIVDMSSGGGLKWENLLGRPIISELADAYRPSQNEGADSKKSKEFECSEVSKRSLVSRWVRAVCYQRMKIGMNLYAVCRQQ